MMTIDDVPESLHEWWRLNDEYDRRDKEFYELPEHERDDETWEQVVGDISKLIVIAWEEAPWTDRFRVDWRMLKQVWRERNAAQGSQG